jgi:hypothetical protein
MSFFVFLRTSACYHLLEVLHLSFKYTIGRMYMDILAINCGSSSVKYQLFDWAKKEVIAKGVVERVVVGGSSSMRFPVGTSTKRNPNALTTTWQWISSSRP